MADASETKSPRVGIVGAGLTGLLTAHGLKKVPNIPLIVLHVTHNPQSY